MRLASAPEDHGLHLDDAGGNLDEAEAQRVELGDAPHPNALASTRVGPTSASRAYAVQEQPKLVGCSPWKQDVRSTRQMGLPGLDMVFGMAAAGK